MRKKKETGELSFEESVNRLSQIVSQLEDESIELDEAANLFSHGIDILAECELKLDTVNGKIMKLKKNKNGKLVEETLNLI